jgi:catechol 2,3-dioxygenase-like lactoylglutathione lyase family enzyme
MNTDRPWPKFLPAVQIRIARPTNQLDKVVAFYRDGLGLEEIGSFENHDGYSSKMLGLPGYDYHLEFTQHEGAAAIQSPHPDQLLVFYIPDPQSIGRLVVKLGAMGYFPVPPENPYWENKSVTIADPDGYRIVLCETEGLG